MDDINIISARDMGNGTIRIWATLRHLTAANVDREGRLRRHPTTLEPLGCTDCDEPEGHFHPIVIATGNATAPDNWYDEVHFAGHPTEPFGGHEQPACPCKPRQMTPEEFLAFCKARVAEQWPDPKAGEVLL